QKAFMQLQPDLIELLEEARNDEVKTLGADHPSTVATTLILVDAYLASGRTRDTVPLLVSALSANPNNDLVVLKVAALQGWFGQGKDLAATRGQILAFARGTNDWLVADCAAKVCSLLPSNDQAEREAALALGRTGVQVAKNEWTLLSLGMAEYRSGNEAAA